MIEVTDKDKHSSLLRHEIITAAKVFMLLASAANVLLPQVTNFRDKLERLSLASF